MDRASFEKALEQDRYDEATRRVFADWLEEHGFDEEAKFHREWTREWQEGADYFEGFARKADGATPREVIDAATLFADHGERSLVGNDMGFGADNQLVLGEEVREFWRHWRAYTRRPGLPPRGSPFRCCY